MDWGKLRANSQFVMGEERYKPDFKSLQKYKREMSRSPTNGEKRFKLAYKQSGLSFKLVKQRIFVNTQTGKAYIVDFYIPELAVVVEIDGDTHNTPEAKRYDAIRSEFLRSRKLRVIRFTNQETLDIDSLASRLKTVFFQPEPRTKGGNYHQKSDNSNLINEWLANNKPTILPEVFKRQPREKIKRHCNQYSNEFLKRQAGMK